MMIERVIILVVLTGLALLAYQMFKRWEVRRAGRVAQSDPLLAEMQPGVPAILYFTTPTCAPCRTQQRPALHDLLSELGSSAVQVIEVNALEQPDAADRWGVLSVPTTFILDAQGQPRQINHGVANAQKLKLQLRALSR
jgi:thiol-disulfide isomerase/thioredoxin